MLFKTWLMFSAFYGVSVDALMRNDLTAIPDLQLIQYAPVSENRRWFQAQQICSALGRLGEEIVVELERSKLAGTGYEGRVSRMPARNQRNHYDVLSAFPDGRPKYIEVKSTPSSNPNYPFFLTAAELAFVRSHAGKGDYLLYRIYALESKERFQYVAYTADEVLALFDIVPNEFILKRKGIA